MGIVTAGMHDPLVLRPKLHICELLHGEPVHVGPKGYHPPLLPSLEGPYDASPSNPFYNFNSKRPQLLGDHPRRFRLMVGKLRVLVDRSPRLHDFWLNARRFREEIHGAFPAATLIKAIEDTPAMGKTKSSVVGLDLAGSPKRNTGFCVMSSGLLCRVLTLHSDEEILSKTINAEPELVSIDAPLFLPKGPKSLEDRGPPHFRECDKELLRMHIRFFPISLGPMRMLTSRGMKLRKELESTGLEVIESFPGAIQDILGFPRKQAGIDKLAGALVEYGLKFDRPATGLNGDELDATTSALVGMMHLNGESRTIGDPAEGLMVLPASRNQKPTGAQGSA